MYCEECQKRPANVHLVKIVNGNKVEKNLCEQCAMEAQDQFGLYFENDFSFPNILGSILQSESFPSLGNINVKNMSCDKCGLTYNQFVKSGRLGCDKCYAYFGERLNSLLRRVQGTTSHTGKLPKRSGSQLRHKQELKRLKDQLKQLVAREEYEAAAELRDRIKELERNYKRE
ncbi:MAG: hypothetical protein GX923_09025 [Clostridia bacterium]|nr:hypothetical protein [Clostridia bacterium]